MLTIEIPEQVFWDEDAEEFIRVKAKTLTLEHYLLAISKWESKWKKPFLAGKEHTMEESRDYVRCMTLTQSVDPKVYLGLSDDIYSKITEYINDSMTATWFSEEQKRRRGGVSREVITSELIYYWMISYNIPFSCEKWHLNRLLTLIQICGIKQEKPQKIPKGKLARSNAALNAARRARLGSRG